MTARELYGQREMGTAREIARWEAAAARHLPLKFTCLDRALTLWWLLRKRGIAAELRIGGRKKSGKFEAHAWVEVRGARVSDANDQAAEFVAFEQSITAMGAQTI